MNKFEAIIVATAGIALACVIVEQIIYTALAIRQRKKDKEH
ncbi:MAG: hypothetical protein ACRC8W_02025 [Plesiomonas shigelloides]